MGIFDRFRKSNSVPDWAHCLSGKEFLWFQNAARTYFIEHSIEADFDFEDGRIDVKSGLMANMQLGLHNLVFRCKGEDAATMVGICQDWFGQFWDMAEEDAMVKNSSLNQVEHLIEARIFQRISEDFPTARILNGELCLVPVFNLSMAIKTIGLDDCARFDITAEEILDRALERTLSRIKTLSVHIFENPELPGAHLITDDDNVFVTTGILAIEELTGLSPAYGFLAIIPTRHDLLVYPLEAGVSSKVLEKMSWMAIGRFNSSEGGISPRTFWAQGEAINLLEESKGPVLDLLKLTVGWD